MKYRLALLILATTALALSSCGGSNLDDSDDAELLPAIPRFSSDSSSRGITWDWPLDADRPVTDPLGCEDQANLTGPLLKGLDANTGTVRVGDAVTVNIIGYDVVLSTSLSEDGFTFEGTLPGNMGLVVVRVKDGMLYYHQEVLVDTAIMPVYAWYVSADFEFELANSMTALVGTGANRFPMGIDEVGMSLKETSNEVFIDGLSYLMVRDESMTKSKEFVGKQILRTYDLTSPDLRAIVDAPSAEFVSASETGASAMYMDARGYWYMIFYTYGDTITFQMDDAASSAENFASYSLFRDFLASALKDHERVQYIPSAVPD